MKGVSFKDQNIVFAEDQPEYESLPALKIDSKEGYVVTCWKMSILERLQVLFTGRVWMSLMMFHKPLTPSFLSVRRKDVYSLPSDSLSLMQW